MPHRIAASFALIAFAACLVIGGVHVGNTFSTTVGRALVALVATYVIGLVLGVMGQKMIDENLRIEEEKLKVSAEKLQPNDR